MPKQEFQPAAHWECLGRVYPSSESTRCRPETPIVQTAALPVSLPKNRSLVIRCENVDAMIRHTALRNRVPGPHLVG